MRTGIRAALAVVAVATFGVAREANAQERKLLRTYFFQGDVEGRFDDGSIRLGATGPDGIEVFATERRKKGSVDWTGRARLEGQVLTIRRVTVTTGVATRVEGGAAQDEGLEYVALLDEKLERGAVRVYRVAQGRRTELGRASLAKGPPFWAALPGELIAIATKEIDKALHREIKLDEAFSITNYGHVGARVSTRILKDSERSDHQKEADRVFRAAGRGEPFWIRTVVEGGPRVAWGTSIPLDSAGVVRVNAGFSLGAQLRYVCDDPQRVPANLTDVQGALDVLETAPARAIALPLSAEKAEQMPLGSRRTFDGNGALAISGGVSFGYRLEDLGILEKRADVGASGGVGVTWSLRGDLMLEVQREAASKVRVKWTKSTGGGIGGYAGAVIGLSVSPELLAQVPGPAAAEKVVEAVVKQGTKYTKIEFNASVDWMRSKELVVDLVFDLADPRARSAYEQAVLGNLISAQELTAGTGTEGLVEGRITSTLTDALTFSANFRAFKILSFSTSSRSADVKIDVATLDGTSSTTESATYTKTTNGLFGGRRTLFVDATDREVTPAAGTAQRGRLATFRFEQQFTSLDPSDVDAGLLLARKLFGEAAIAEDRARLVAARRDDDETEKGKLTLEIVLGDRSVEKILHTGEDEFLLAYGHAFWDKSYEWTKQRRRSLDYAPRGNDLSYQEQQEELEARFERDAEWAYRVVKKARKDGVSRADRMAAFRKIAKTDGFELRAVVCFALLADPSDVAIKLTIEGKGVSFSKTTGAVAPLPTHP